MGAADVQTAVVMTCAEAVEERCVSRVGQWKTAVERMKQRFLACAFGSSPAMNGERICEPERAG